MDMTYALIVSSGFSWLLNLALILAVFALARQVGLLHERIRPVGALSLGKAIKAGESRFCVFLICMRLPPLLHALLCPQSITNPRPCQQGLTWVWPVIVLY